MLLRPQVSSDINKVAIAAAGAIDPLVQMISCNSEACRMSAAAALRNLALNMDNKLLIADAGVVEPLIRMLTQYAPQPFERGTSRCAIYAAGAIRNLSTISEIQLAFAAGGAIPPLVQMVEWSSFFSASAQGKVVAAEALSNLATNTGIAGLIFAAGAIGPLVKMVADDKEAPQAAASRALASLSAADGSSRAAILAEGAVWHLQRVKYFAGSSKGTDAATAALANLAL